jgi:A/G-specific adenine glycosylase
MLQQTQVSRVLKKYPEFLRLFPSFSSLAHASTANVIRAWAGMGYNNRALRLHQIAKLVVNEYNRRLPNDIEILLLLPGIGRYTAHAIACFSFGQQTAVVDTNVRRVLSRLFPAKARSMDEWDLAESFLPKRKAYDWNQALMELGGIHCTTSNPHCTECPLKLHCPSAFQIKRLKISGKKKPRLEIPNRIFRGKIVALLRTLGYHQIIESNQLLKMIQPGESHRRKKWLSLVLTGLQHDGLIQIRIRKTKQYISLPT